MKACRAVYAACRGVTLACEEGIPAVVFVPNRQLANAIKYASKVNVKDCLKNKRQTPINRLNSIFVTFLSGK